MARFAALLILASSITDLRAETPKELAAVAAAKGDLDAMFELGLIALSKGEYPEAKVWLQKAGELGSPQAGQILKDWKVKEEELKK